MGAISFGVGPRLLSTKPVRLTSPHQACCGHHRFYKYQCAPSCEPYHRKPVRLIYEEILGAESEHRRILGPFERPQDPENARA